MKRLPETAPGNQSHSGANQGHPRANSGTLVVSLRNASESFLREYPRVSPRASFINPCTDSCRNLQDNVQDPVGHCEGYKRIPDRVLHGILYYPSHHAVIRVRFAEGHTAGSWRKSGSISVLGSCKDGPAQLCRTILWDLSTMCFSKLGHVKENMKNARNHELCNYYV